MAKKRIDRINSLLKEVISEVIRKDVRNAKVSPLLTVTHVETSADLKYAKISISVIGSEQVKKETVEALESAAGFIAVHASKKVTLRYFPELTFKLDHSVDQHIRISEILDQIHEEQRGRGV